MTRKRNLPFMKLFPADLDADCSHLKLATRGAWVWIFIHLWRTGGTDRLTVAEWAKVIRASIQETVEALVELEARNICDILPYFERDDGVMSCVIPNLDHFSITDASPSEDIVMITCRRTVRDLKALNLHAHAQKRYREKLSLVNHSDKKVTPEKLRSRESKNIDSTNSSSGTLIKEDIANSRVGKKNRKTLSRFPSDFVVSVEMANWAKEKGLDGIADQTERFRDYHLSNQSEFGDWPAAWRNWMRKSKEFARAPGGNGRPAPGAHIGRPPADDETTPEYRAHMAELNARVDRELQALESPQSKFIAYDEEI